MQSQLALSNVLVFVGSDTMSSPSGCLCFRSAANKSHALRQNYRNVNNKCAVVLGGRHGWSVVRRFWRSASDSFDRKRVDVINPRGGQRLFVVDKSHFSCRRNACRRRSRSGSRASNDVTAGVELFDLGPSGDENNPKSIRRQSVAASLRDVDNR